MHLNISRNIKNMTTSIPLTSSWTISVVGKSENQSRVVEFGLFPDFRVFWSFSIWQEIRYCLFAARLFIYLIMVEEEKKVTLS